MAGTAASSHCISSSTELLGPGLSFASAALFLFEYTLTLVAEVRFVWLRPRSTSAALFYVARYAGMASAVLTLVATPTTTVLLANLGTALRVVVIVASEAILAVRTWAIWGRSRPILLLLFLVSVGALAGEAVVIVRGVKGTHVQTDTTADGCASEVVSSQSNAYLVPYIIVLAYETLTTTLSAHRILRWRRQSQSQGGAAPPLLAVLWKDGLLYFSWMIGLGILNILLVLRGSVAVRTGGAQLQTSIHSILSTRVVLHLASLPAARAPQPWASSVANRSGSGSGSGLFAATTVLLGSGSSSGVSDYYYEGWGYYGDG